MKKTIKKLEQIIAELGDVLTELKQQTEVDLQRFAEIEKEQTFCKALERKRVHNLTPEPIGYLDSQGTWIKKGDRCGFSDFSEKGALEIKWVETFSHVDTRGRYVDNNGFHWKYAVKRNDK